MGCLADARHDNAGDFSNTPDLSWIILSPWDIFKPAFYGKGGI